MKVALAGLIFMVMALGGGSGLAFAQSTASTASSDKPYLVEWVYRVKYGYKDEWWKIFQKYQIATLDKEKELGYVTGYLVYAPGLHTSEESRWDYRVVITYRNQDSAGHGEEIERQLFPNWDVAQREEDKRWQLTENHWDLPIHVVDAHAQQ